MHENHCVYRRMKKTIVSTDGWRKPLYLPADDNNKDDRHNNIKWPQNFIGSRHIKITCNKSSIIIISFSAKLNNPPTGRWKNTSELVITFFRHRFYGGYEDKCVFITKIKVRRKEIWNTNSFTGRINISHLLKNLI